VTTHPKLADHLDIKAVLYYLLPILWQARYLFVLATLQVFSITAIELLKPWPLKFIVDNIIGHQVLVWGFVTGLTDKMLLAITCTSLACLYTLASYLTFINNRLLLNIGKDTVNRVRDQLYTHLLAFSPSYHAKSRTGDLLYRLISDAGTVETLIVSGLFPVLISIILLLSMLVIMLMLNITLTVVALAVCPVLFFFTRKMSWEIDTKTRIARNGESNFYSRVQQALTSIRTIKAFATEQAEHECFMASSDNTLSTINSVIQKQCLHAQLTNVIIALGMSGVLWTGTYSVIAGMLSLGELLVFTGYLAMLYQHMNTISRSIGIISASFAGLARIQQILCQPTLPTDGKRVLMDREIRGEIVFENVTFGYEEGLAVIRDFSLSIRQGEKIAIVGETGVGKSTLVHLILRFDDPWKGRILLDGIDLREITLKSLRQCISTVLQPSMIFAGTVVENIVFGQPKSDMETIEAAAKKAQIHNKIVNMSLGYNSMIGEKGDTMSEGERQRINLCRALLKKSPILIFDEPTSSVDTLTEAKIMKNLEKHWKGLTTVIIAHRLSTVRNADTIVVLGKGTIIERGNFNELINGPTQFAKLYRTQLEETSIFQL